MAMHEISQRPPKTLTESAACFAFTAIALAAAAVGIQWILHLLP